MGCDKRGDGDGNNNNTNNRRGSSEAVDEDEVPYTGLRTMFVCSTHRDPVTRQEINASRRKLKEHGLLEPTSRVTKDDPRFGYKIVETLGGPVIGYVINGRATSASAKRRKAEKRKKKTSRK
uniref:uncharacterized protein LOC122598022 isoform X1 n=1 Tax=Erigeron canadensis TaxID=72917 RepID=UPI001CB98BEC|nr:uncharacterized protein LOC122598022 isoform X1 [Erigeron canadensis]